MKILVTGGAGYIGSVLVPTLLEQGYAVTVLDNFMYRQVSLLDCCHYDGLQVVRGDVRDDACLKVCMADVDIIIPLACLTGAPLCEQKPEEAQQVIVDSLKTLLSCRLPKQQILYPTTNSGYGIGEEGKHCTEETPLRPISLYGRLKVEAERHVLASGNAISLRLATAFGISPRMRLDLLVNDFVYRALHEGSVTLFEAHMHRNFIHVRDVARAIVHCIHHFERMKDQAYNLGLSEANLSKRQLCEEIRKCVPAFVFDEDEIGEDPDKRDYIVSNAKIEKTGFVPKYSLQQGIEELVRGYAVMNGHSFSNV